VRLGRSAAGRKGSSDGSAKDRIYLAEKGIEVEIDPAYRNLARWSATFGQRPSANL